MTRLHKGGSDSYTAVTVFVVRKTPRAIIIRQDGEEIPVGRSLLSHISEEEVESTLEFPASLDLEIRSWLVKQEGLDK